MSQVITNAFENYWQSCLTAEQPVVLDEFILADIPNLDITSPIDPETGLPPESQIVHRQNVDQRGRINNNAVAYTIVMDTTVGDFSFNAMYLRNSQNGVIGMIVYKGRETKLKTDQTTGQTGNSLVKSMLMGYDQAAEATLTNVDAGTWQIDYAARLRGQDEDLRKLTCQLYGHHTFIGDGFKVVEKDGAYQVSQGVAIIGGLRVELKAPEVIHPGSQPIGVWVDVHRAGSLLSEHQNHFTIITSVADLTDHVDSNGYQHYVAKLATVLVDGTIEDGRGITSSETSIHDALSSLKMADEQLDTNNLEGMRRSYLEAGLFLRPKPESFQNGGFLTGPRDVLIDIETGKAYSGTPGEVMPGTDPLNGEFVDRSGALLRDQIEISISSTAKMVQQAILENGLTKRFCTGGTAWRLIKDQSPITLDNFRAFNSIYVDDLYDGIGEYADALQAAVNKAFDDGCDVLLAPARRRVSRTIVIPMGLNYHHQGTHIRGFGRGKSILDFDNVNRSEYAIAGFQQHAFDDKHGYANCVFKDFSMENTYGNASDISAHILMESATGCLWDNLHLSGSVTSIHFKDDAWLNSFTNIFMAPRDYGFRMDNSGTTNWWDGLFVFGSNVTAYKLRSGYSAIGSLAADDCTGVAYDLRFFRGSVGALGSEQPTKGRLLSKLLLVDHSSLTIGSLLAFRGIPNAGATWVGIEVGVGNVAINDFVIDAHDQTPGDKVSSAKLIDGFSGDVKIRNLVVVKDSNNLNGGTLKISPSSIQNTTVAIDSPNGTAVAVTGDGHPAIAGSRYNASPFEHITGKEQIVQSIVFDNYGSPKHGGSSLDYKYRYSNGYRSGSIFTENDPARWGVAAYVATNTSDDIDGQTFLRVPAINVVEPVAPADNVSYRDQVTKKQYWWDASTSVWRDANGVAK